MQISHKVTSTWPMGHPEIHLSWGYDENLWNHFWIHEPWVAHSRTRSKELKSAINLLWVTLWMQHLNQSTWDTYFEHENRQLKGCMRLLYWRKALVFSIFVESFQGLPICVLNIFVCPHLAFFASVSPCMLSLPHYYPLYLSTGYSLCFLHVHAWSKGTTSLARATRVRMQVRRCKPKNGNVQNIRRPSLPDWFSLSLSSSLFP